MKRRLTIVLLCLFAGAAINVFVASVISVSTDIPSRARASSRAGNPSRVDQLNWESPSVTPYLLYPWVNEAGRSARLYLTDYRVYIIYPPVSSVSPVSPYMILEGRYGWPMKSSTSWIPMLELHRTRGSRSPDAFYSPWRIGIQSPITFASHPELHRVAIMPLPIGFVVNSLFYGMLVLLTLVSVRRMRQGSRRRIGRCFNCGYTLEDLPICPECGTPARREAAAP